MDRWEIITSLSNMKENIGDRLLINGKEYTIQRIDKHYVYLNDDKYFPADMFRSWWQLMLKHKQLRRSFDQRQTDILYREESIIDFATWYSGMDKEKVARAYIRYLKEVNKKKQ
jgi:hypothetical protein